MSHYRLRCHCFMQIDKPTFLVSDRFLLGIVLIDINYEEW
ncbi:hypothetical protein VAE063_900209 [Vibrio aestuarianus]|uniref:Uncharacterized protein n=1 Tax=Vibrio aestuarianus TaxID=28171 RepID=A0ABN8TSD0_9VIBR|nr:hypothetical protein VAE016_350210 [Vibrio aestuarianus]CAH8216522.1 hypothetical protein VAE063_900209 [Vibrio aestuarianus]